MKPSVGRVVHYVSYGTPGGEFTPQCRAAIVTAVSPYGSALVDLCVLNPTGMYFNQGCLQAEGEPEPRGGSWHWPEREPEREGGK